MINKYGIFNLSTGISLGVDALFDLVRSVYRQFLFYHLFGH